MSGRSNGATAPLLAPEWFFTVLFTVNNTCCGSPASGIRCATRGASSASSTYSRSCRPTSGLLFPGAHFLLDVRVLRAADLLRISKLVAYVGSIARSATLAAVGRDLVFLSIVLMLVLVMGTLMYGSRGPENGYRASRCPSTGRSSP
ncbi:MAG: hypothetical protein IPI40_03310 [Betaproteobacteria bacterium]|nr:hypothetical protein [Betaproteobacteria bacterium]